MYYTEGIAFHSSNTSYAAGATFYQSGGTTNELMRITNGGNVGIGTTAPSQQLHITGYLRTLGISVNETGGTISAFIGYENDWIGSGTSNDLAIAAETNNNLKFYTNGTGTVRMMINTSGNVGIGTTSPGYKLDIQGSAGISTTLRLVGNMTVGGDTSQWILAGVANGGAIWQKSHSGAGGSDDRYLRLGNVDNNGTPNYVMTIFNSSVGIGSTNPAYTLDVNGTIRATGDVIAYSDARVKENVETISDALAKITSLRGVSYTRKDSEDKSRKVGVIAQEVLDVLPEVVQQDINGNYSVAYGNVVGVLIEAIKELKAEINELKNK
jgi:hypothetical protein